MGSSDLGWSSREIARLCEQGKQLFFFLHAMDGVISESNYVVRNTFIELSGATTERHLKRSNTWNGPLTDGSQSDCGDLRSEETTFDSDCEELLSDWTQDNSSATTDLDDSIKSDSLDLVEHVMDAPSVSVRVPFEEEALPWCGVLQVYAVPFNVVMG